MRRLLIAFLLALPILAPANCESATPYDSIRPLAVVTQPVPSDPNIVKQDFICTVTSVNERHGFWLTAEHCIHHGLNFVDGHQAVIIYDNPLLDLAVLHTYDYSLPAVKFAVEEPVVGQHVKMIGHPVGLPDVQFFQGYVSSLNTNVEVDENEFARYMMFDMSVCGGNSGSVVLNDRDEVVSVMQIGFGRPCSVFSGGATWAQLQAVARYFGE